MKLVMMMKDETNPRAYSVLRKNYLGEYGTLNDSWDEYHRGCNTPDDHWGHTPWKSNRRFQSRQVRRPIREQAYLI